jgi:hypothetical protein
MLPTLHLTEEEIKIILDNKKTTAMTKDTAIKLFEEK